MKQAENKIVIGCSGIPKQIGFKKYFEELQSLEVTVLASGNPTPKTLRKWRQTCGDHIEFSINTPAFDFSKEHRDFHNSTESKRLFESVSALKSTTVSFSNTNLFSPSTSNRDILLKFFESVQKMLPHDTRIFWFPKGLWSLSMALELTKDSPFFIGFDPLANDALNEIADIQHLLFRQQNLYLRIEQTGHQRNRFDSNQLETLAQNISIPDNVWVYFNHHGAFADSKLFNRLVLTNNNKETQ